MSYGIVCREPSCKAYASRKVPNKVRGFYCKKHAPEGSDTIDVKMHNGPEGMRSIEEQKGDGP